MPPREKKIIKKNGQTSAIGDPRTVGVGGGVYVYVCVGGGGWFKVTFCQ